MLQFICCPFLSWAVLPSELGEGGAQRSNSFVRTDVEFDIMSRCPPWRLCKCWHAALWISRWSANGRELRLQFRGRSASTLSFDRWLRLTHGTILNHGLVIMIWICSVPGIGSVDWYWWIPDQQDSTIEQTHVSDAIWKNKCRWWRFNMTTGLKMSSKPCHVPCACMLAHGVKMFVFCGVFFCLALLPSCVPSSRHGIHSSDKSKCCAANFMFKTGRYGSSATYDSYDYIFWHWTYIFLCTSNETNDPYEFGRTLPVTILSCWWTQFVLWSPPKQKTHAQHLPCLPRREHTGMEKTLRIEHILTSTKVFGTVTICGIYKCVSLDIQFCPIQYGCAWK